MLKNIRFFLLLAIGLATGWHQLTHAAVENTRAVIKKSDIVEILKTDNETGSILVKVKDGNQFRLKLTSEQIEEVKKSVQLASTGNNTALSAAVAKTSTSIEKVVPTKSKWSFSHMIRSFANVQQLHNAEGDVTLHNLPNINYKLNNGVKLGFVPSFQIAYNLEKSAAKNDLMAWQLTAAKGGIKLPFGIDLNLKGRYYAPTSPSLRAAQAIGLLRLDAKFAKKLNSRMNVYYQASPRFYLQTKASIFTEDDINRVTGEAKANRSFRYVHAVGATQTMNSTFELEQVLYLDHQFSYADEAVGVTGGGKTFLGWDLGVNMNLAKWLSMSFVLEQEHDLSGEDSYSLFNTKEMTYFLISSFKF